MCGNEEEKEAVEKREKEEETGEEGSGEERSLDNNRNLLRRLSKSQKRKRLTAAVKKQHLTAQSEIEKLSAALSLPDETKECSKDLYCEAWENNLIHGRSIEKILAASLYLACRKSHVPRTLNEVETATKVRKKDIAKTCKVLASRLKMQLALTSGLDYVDRFCDKLGLRGEVEERAREIIKKAEEKNITSGRGPTGVAASAIYIASVQCGNRRTQKNIAEATGVTEVTLRVRYKELSRELGIKVE